MIILYVTHPTEEHAASILKSLIQEQLVACGNIYPIRSIYPWEGKLLDEKEYVTIIKSSELKQEAIINRISELHEYEIPCILTITADANTQYLEWINKCLGII